MKKYCSQLENLLFAVNCYSSKHKRLKRKLFVAQVSIVSYFSVFGNRIEHSEEDAIPIILLTFHTLRFTLKLSVINKVFLLCFLYIYFPSWAFASKFAAVVIMVILLVLGPRRVRKLKLNFLSAVPSYDFNES